MTTRILRPRNIIGIAPGTNVLGIAILQNNVLVAWKTKRFKNAWSKGKLERIVSTIEKDIERYDIGAITFKALHPSRSSNAIEKIVSGIHFLAATRSIYVNSASIEELERQYSQDEPINSEQLIEAVAVRFPELASRLKRHKKSKNRYHLKVFEAVACADFANTQNIR